jgi:hypothetical protein
MTIGLVYRSPSSTDTNNLILNTLLKSVSDAKPQNLLILGDFNYPEIEWDGNTCRASENHPATKFLHAIKESFLIEHVREPTRIRDGQRSTLDDLVLTNKDEIVSDISIAPALGKSDHVTLLISLACMHKQLSKPPHRNYAKADYGKMRDELEAVNWKEELENQDVNSAWTVFRQHLEKTSERHVPTTRMATTQRKKWLDSGTLKTVRTKHKLYRRWLQSKAGEDYQAYVKARNKAARACRSAKRKLEATVAAQAKTNPKSFWSYVQSKTKTHTGVADLKRDDGTKATTDKEKADILNQFFQSVFTVEKDGYLPETPAYNYDAELVDFEITTEAVRKLLASLKTNKASGPDGISPRLLAELSDILAEPIAIIFKKSLESGTVPDEWRKATVSPIFKKGSRLQANNYRPVSLTCILCKVMETLVRAQIIEHLQHNNLVSRQQHGFTHGRSCVTQLLETLDVWTEVLDDGGSIDAVYMDYMKAFDSVPHRRLVAKVEAHGISGKVLQWVRNFLTNRTQQVAVNGFKSSPADVTSGIPQGSVLGPVLFVLYINDLPRHVQSYAELFADDTKVFNRSDCAEGRNALQQDLDSLHRWSTDWQLRFHPQKCSVLRLGNPRDSTVYTMKGRNEQGEECTIELKESEVERDLGVMVDNGLSFKKHVAQATAKANKIVGIIRRTFDYLTPETFVQLYKSLVRPVLEYGHSVWQPRHKTLCIEVEDVQRRATKLIGVLKDKTYPERLAALKLPSLEHRRARGDLIDAYKYVHNIYDTDRPQLQLHDGRDTRGNSLKLAKGRCRLDVRASFFSQRVVSSWNSLPDSIVTAPTVNAFKNRLDKHWANLPTRFNPECYQ